MEIAVIPSPKTRWSIGARETLLCPQNARAYRRPRDKTRQAAFASRSPSPVKAGMVSFADPSRRKCSFSGRRDSPDLRRKSGVNVKVQSRTAESALRIQGLRLKVH